MGVVGESLEIRWGTGDTLLIISRTDYYLFDLPIISCYSNFVSTSCSQLKSEKNKATRALQLNSRHTTGSRSNAVALDQLVFPDSIVVLSIYYVAKRVSTYHWIPLQELKEGRQIGRAELYVQHIPEKMESQLMITAVTKLYAIFFHLLVSVHWFCHAQVALYLLSNAQRLINLSHSNFLGWN